MISVIIEAPELRGLRLHEAEGVLRVQVQRLLPLDMFPRGSRYSANMELIPKNPAIYVLFEL